MGYKASLDAGRKMLRRHDAQERAGGKQVDFEAIAKWMYNSEIARIVLALTYFSGRISAGVGYRVDYYAIPLQLLVVLAVLSAFFTTVQGGLILIVLAIGMVFALSPTLGSIYYRQPFFEANIPLLTVLKFHSTKLFTIQKLTLISLTLSFAGGVLHHRSLIAEPRILNFTGEVNVSANLVMTSSSGFVIYGAEFGYRFVPIDGTQIEVAVQ